MEHSSVISLFIFKSSAILRKVLFILVFLAVGSMQAFANQHTELGDLSLEELMTINVSVGTLFDENELDIANTVDLVTHQQWQKRGARNYLDAIGFLSSINPLLNIWGSAITIRGFATNLSKNGVGHLVDGVPVNNMSDMSSGYDETMQILGLLDRVEVLRGPGSALYGSDAFHGVFSLKTFRSDKDVVISRAEAGALGVHDVSLQASFGQNQWRINTAFALQGQGDQKINYDYTDPDTGGQQTAEREGSLNQHGFVVALEGAFNVNLNAQLSYYRTGRDLKEAVGGGRGPTFGLGKSLARERDSSTVDNSFNMFKGQLTHRYADNITLTMMGYFWAKEWNRSHDLHYHPSNFFPNITQEYRGRETAQGADITLKYQAKGTGLQWLLQLQHKVADTDMYKVFHVNQLTGLEYLFTVPPAEGYRREVNSVIAQGKMPLWGEKLNLILGGRVDDYSDLGEQSTPKAGIVYRANRNQSLRFNYGQAFRAPSSNELLGNPGVGKKPNAEIEPEVIDTYEVSYIHIVNRHRYSLTLFNSHWEDAIDIDESKFQNKERESIGVELGLKGVNDSLQYELNGAYVRSRNVDTDSDMGAFPEMALNAIGSYYWHQYDVEVTLANRLKARMKEAPVSSADEDPRSLPLYFRMDLNVTHHLSDDASIWFTVRNLANRKNFLPSLWNVENGNPDDSFSVAVGAGISF